MYCLSSVLPEPCAGYTLCCLDYATHTPSAGKTWLGLDAVPPGPNADKTLYRSDAEPCVHGIRLSPRVSGFKYLKRALKCTFWKSVKYLIL